MGKDRILKRDDDSAIGDSENYSAGEDSSYSGRKSVTSYETDDVLSDSQCQSHLDSKFGAKIPNCLLQSSEKSVEKCKRKFKLSFTKEQNNKKLTTVLPTSDIMFSKTSKRVDKDLPHMDVLETKLQCLFFEMKKLRELDRDILRTFVAISDSVDEVKWKFEESEEDIRRNIEGDDLDDEIVTTLSFHRRVKASESEFSAAGHIKAVTPLPTSIKSLLPRQNGTNSSISSNVTGDICVKATKIAHATQGQDNDHVVLTTSMPSAFVNPTYAFVGANEALENGRRDDLVEGGDEIWKMKSELASYNSSVCDDHHLAKSRYSVKSKRSSGRRRVETTQKNINITAGSSKKDSEKQLKQQAGYKGDTSFRLITDENSRIGKRNTWLTENKVSSKSFDFQKHRDYQNLIGISRVKPGSQQTPVPNRQRCSSKSSASSNSQVSATFSAVLSSHTSFSQPTYPPESRSNRWKGLSFNKASRSLSVHDRRHVGTAIVNNNYKDNASLSRKPPGNASRVENVIPVSYKRTSETIDERMHNQDDVTYL